MDERTEGLEASLRAMFPDVEFEIEESRDGQWVVITRAVTTGDKITVGKGASRQEAIEVAHRQVTIAFGATALFEAVGAFLKSRKKTSSKTQAAPTRSGLLDRTGDTKADPASPVPPTADAIGGFGWRLEFEVEPDQSFRWWVYDSAGKLLYDSGVSDDWDDAKLSAVMKLLPPSAEGRRVVEGWPPSD